ncbi:MAG TPA: hypothetical protein VGG06_03995 [Thermoanaerobaculia bacterium]
MAPLLVGEQLTHHAFTAVEETARGRGIGIERHTGRFRRRGIPLRFLCERRLADSQGGSQPRKELVRVDPLVKRDSSAPKARPQALEQPGVALLDAGLLLLVERPQHFRIGMGFEYYSHQGRSQDVVPAPVAHGHQHGLVAQQLGQGGFELRACVDELGRGVKGIGTVPVAMEMDHLAAVGNRLSEGAVAVEHRTVGLPSHAADRDPDQRIEVGSQDHLPEGVRQRGEDPTQGFQCGIESPTLEVLLQGLTSRRLAVESPLVRLADDPRAEHRLADHLVGPVLAKAVLEKAEGPLIAVRRIGRQLFVELVQGIRAGRELVANQLDHSGDSRHSGAAGLARGGKGGAHQEDDLPTRAGAALGEPKEEVVGITEGWKGKAHSGGSP